jgi:hypothetical protein
MAELAVGKAISDDEDLMKALTKQIYYKRTETIGQLLEERKDELNFIGLINLEKGNTCRYGNDPVLILCMMLNSYELLKYFLETVRIFLNSSKRFIHTYRLRSSFRKETSG